MWRSSTALILPEGSAGSAGVGFGLIEISQQHTGVYAMKKKNKTAQQHVITASNWRPPVEGDDRGTREAILKRPIVRTQIKVDGAVQTVNKRATAFDMLHARGTINDEQYRVGVMFKDAFDRGRLDELRAVDMLSAGRGAGGIKMQDLSAAACDARDVVYAMTKVIGGVNTMASWLVWEFIGFDRDMLSMEMEVRSWGVPARRDVLKGYLLAALDMLVAWDEERRSKKSA